MTGEPSPADPTRDGTSESGLVEPVAQLVEFASRLALHSHAVGALVEGQSQALDQARSLAGEMRASAEEVASAAQQSAETAVANHNAATQGDALVTALLEQLDATAQVAAAAEAELQELVDRVARVSEVASQIDRIAGQTKMLALNATIEAARAGLEGAGFGVVAQEVGRLAQASAEAVDSVRDITDAATLQAARAAEAGTEIRSAIGAAAERGREAGAHFADIAQGTAELEGIATGTASAAEQQAQAAGHLDETADGIALIAAATVQSAAVLTTTVREVEDSTGRLGGQIAPLLHPEATARLGRALVDLHAAFAPVTDLPRHIAGHVSALAYRKTTVAGQLSSDDLRSLDPALRQTLDRVPGATHNVGFAVEPARLADADLLIRCWAPGANGPQDISPSTDRTSPEFYDYTETDWYRVTVRRRAPWLTNPFYDASLKAMMVTATFPLFDDGGLVAVAWVDLDMTRLQRLCAPVLAGLPPTAIVTREGVIVDSNDERRFQRGESIDARDELLLVRSPALEWQLAVAR